MRNEKVNSIIRKRLRKFGAGLRSLETEIAEILDLLEVLDEDTGGKIPRGGIRVKDALPEITTNKRHREIYVKDDPNLTFTKARGAVIDGKTITENNWNGILENMFYIAHNQAGGVDGLALHCPTINFSRDDDEENGFKYLERLDFSYQGASVQCMWPAIHSLALWLGISVEVRFVWLRKKKAAFPGERGIVKLGVV